MVYFNPSGMSYRKVHMPPTNLDGRSRNADKTLHNSVLLRPYFLWLINLSDRCTFFRFGLYSDVRAARYSHCAPIY